MLCDEIHRLRLASGITQARLAERLGVSKQSVSNWENNNIQPSVELLERLADFFAVSTDALLGRQPDAVIDVSGLTDAQIAHIRQLIQDLRDARRRV
ncbi:MULTISPECIES: helix-turn-helix domain-containing protein, partial [unclassified Oscillibacter]|uniref:helix-turn-helix domain-containing protein n=1 Tax=unclassified Oscillibacter TaxID=2629304 RepID=UPI0025D8F79B